MFLWRAVFSIIVTFMACFQGGNIVNAVSGHGTYVMSLDSRFESIRGQNPFLVEFYAPWCGHCKKLEPIYEKVGAKLDGTGIYVAKVDATLHRDIATRYDVAGFPTILYIQGDRVVNYHGDRTAEDISRFAIRCRREPIQVVHSVGVLNDRLRQSEQEAFFVYIGQQDNHLFTEFSETARNYSIYVDFFTADAKALAKELDEDIKLPIVRVYKDGISFQFDPLTDTRLSSWVSEERYSALQPAQGFALSTLMTMDKLLVLMVCQESSDDVEIKANSKRALDGARPTALDRNLKQFQFVVMDKVSTVSGILMAEVTVPYAIVFHPVTYYYYTPDKLPQHMNTQDWTHFLSGIITGRVEAQGGQGFFVKMSRALYALRSSLLELWTESRLIFGVVVVIPMFVVSLVGYMLCCATWADENGEEDNELSDNEEGDEQDSVDRDQDSGHLKQE